MARRLCQRTLFDRNAPEPLPPPEERPVPDVPVVDGHVWDLHRTYAQGAESNPNTQRQMMERCLEKTKGNMEAATELFHKRMQRSMLRRLRKGRDASSH